MFAVRASGQGLQPLGLLLGALAATIAWSIRLGLNPLVHAESPYLTVVLTAAIVTAYGGFITGLVTTVIGGLAANFSFVGRPDSFDFSGSYSWEFALFLLGSLLTIYTIDASFSSRSRRQSMRDRGLRPPLLGWNPVRAVRPVGCCDVEPILDALQAQEHFLRTVGIIDESGERFKRYTQSVAITNLIEVAAARSSDRQLIDIIARVCEIDVRIKMLTIWRGNGTIVSYSVHSLLEELKATRGLLDGLSADGFQQTRMTDMVPFRAGASGAQGQSSSIVEPM